MKKYRIEFEVRFRGEMMCESEDAEGTIILDETVTLTEGINLINTAGYDLATDAVTTEDEDDTVEFAEIFNIEWYELDVEMGEGAVVEEAQDAEV